MGTKVTLFGMRYSPFSQRVQIALTEKGIPFEMIPVDFSNKPKGLLEANPIYSKVPTIMHDGKPVAESLVILEYLEDAWPQQVPLMPEGAYEKSQVRFWADYLYQFFLQALPVVFGKPGSPERKVGEEKLGKGFQLLEETMTKFSADGPFFTGDKFGILDVIMAPLTTVKSFLGEGPGAPLPGPDVLPRLHKWFQATMAHPSVSKTMPSQDESITFLTELVKQRQLAAAAAASH